jgi:hypothetical protein
VANPIIQNRWFSHLFITEVSIIVTDLIQDSYDVDERNIVAAVKVEIRQLG